MPRSVDAPKALSAEIVYSMNWGNITFIPAYRDMDNDITLTTGVPFHCCDGLRFFNTAHPILFIGLPG